MPRARLFFYVFFAAALSCGATFASAAELQTKNYFSSDAIAAGATVINSDKQFTLDIPGGVFNENVYVYIRNENEGAPEFPNNRAKVSNAYFYDIKVSDPQILKRSVRVALSYYGTAKNNPSVHYYDDARGAWQPIASQLDMRTGTVRAHLPFPSAHVAVFEDGILTEGDVSERVDAVSSLVADATTGAQLFSDNSGRRYPLASLTKMMTGLVFLSHNPGWDKRITISASDQVGGSSAPFKTGERISVRDLYNSMLVGSANNSAHALVRATGLSLDRFVAAMNAQAKELGMKGTVFHDVTGLSVRNVGTAEDVAVLARTVFSKKEFIDATTQTSYSFYTIAAAGARYTVRNTNAMLAQDDLDILGSKTGHLNTSGYNLALKVKRKDRDVIVVIFGSETRKGSFDAARSLAKLF